MVKKRVLLIGIDPALVDFSRSTAGRTVEGVTAAGNAAVAQLQSLGYEVQNCLIDLGETAAAVVVQALMERPVDCILIGAGIRGLPQHTLLFEQVINAIHQHAPTAKLCFNTNPNDTAEAVLRWINA